MATSPIYSWPEPDNTDLVKNGALAIRTLGNAIDTTMGTMVAKTIIDAKGDLIAGSAADTALRLAVGSNGETLVADSSTSTGLRYQSNFAAGKNKIINGDFGVWQRGTSFTNPADSSYTADRFEIRQDGNGTKIITQQTFTAGTAPVAGYEGQYFFRWNDSVAGTTQTFKVVSQKIEDVRTFAGQTVTMSFWAKADAARTVNYYWQQIFGSGGSAAVDGASTTASLTTSWQRFTYTVAVSSISGKTIGTGSNLRFRFDLPLNVAQTIDIWGVQMEASNTATAFQTATGTIQGELAAAQRYYERNTANSTASSQDLGTMAYANATTSGFFHYFYKVTKRTTPSFSSSGTFQLTDAIANNYAITSMSLNTSTSNETLARLNVGVASGLTSKNIYFPQSNATSTSYIEFSAEL